MRRNNDGTMIILCDINQTSRIILIPSAPRRMTAEELNAGCRTYIALQTKDMNRTKALLSCKYSRAEEDESGYIRVYDAGSPAEIVTHLYENRIFVCKIKTDKIGLDEYCIDLMNEKGGK